MVDIHYYQSGGFFYAVTSPASEDSAGSHVGQCLLLQEAAGIVITQQCGVSYFVGECGKFRV